MSAHEQDADRNPEEAHPHGETLPDESPTAGEAARRRRGNETDEPKAGKGGQHPTPGAGEHDDPSN
jgi:hypothetical protein